MEKKLASRAQSTDDVRRHCAQRNPQSDDLSQHLQRWHPPTPSHTMGQVSPDQREGT